MTTAQDTALWNEQTVRKIYEAVRTSDLDAFFSHCAPDVVLEEASSLAVGGVYQGRHEFTSALGALAAAYDLASLEVKHLVAGEEIVVANIELNAAKPADYLIRVSEWWHFQDNKVVLVRPFYWDTEELNAVLRRI